jgi:addiction module RelE/StbE family toxin
MTIRRTSKFKKQYQKLPPKLQLKFDESLRIFIADQSDRRLRIHPLKTPYAGYWSMDVTGDLRALFRRDDNDDIIIFGFIGTHSQLYG